MFINCKCPYCGETGYHSIAFEIEELIFFDFEEVRKYAIENVNLTESITAEVLVSDIIRLSRSHINDGMTIQELSDILKNVFGIVGNCCDDLGKRIIKELDLYSPDQKRLYFAHN